MSFDIDICTVGSKSTGTSDDLDARTSSGINASLNSIDTIGNKNVKKLEIRRKKDIIKLRTKIALVKWFS